MAIKTVNVPSYGTDTEEWVIDHMDFFLDVSQEDWESNPDACRNRLRKHAINEVAKAMVDQGYGKVEHEYRPEAASLRTYTRIKLLRPKK
jgi:hypothetical protein